MPAHGGARAHSLASVAVSSLVFVVVVRGAQVRNRSVEATLQTVTLVFLTALGALGLGLAGDFFVLAMALSRSAALGEVLAGVMLVLVCTPWLSG